jgi:ADP-ribose pyrophosphatase
MIMNNLNEKRLASQTIFTGKILNVRLDRVLLPNGRESTREVVEHPGAVAIIPVQADGRVVLVRQYRYPVDEVLLEIPAGKLDSGEAPNDCAMRELTEETGFRAGKLEKLMSFYSAPGFTNEILHLYLAEDLQVAQQNLDGDEFLSVEVYNHEEIRKLRDAGQIKDGKTLIGLMMAGYLT